MAAAGGPGPTCVLGIDLGTTSVKAALVTGTERGLSLAQSCSRETQAHSDSPGAAPQGMEQDVQKILRALNECLAALPQQQLQQVTHIGISGQMHGVVFWKSDKGCKWSESGPGPAFEADKVSHLVTWQDGRCSPTFLTSLPLPQSHVSLATGFGCATVFWYSKNSPDFLKAYDAAGTIQDYVVAMLCDLKKPLMSVQNAASWGYFNCRNKSWNTDILKKSGFPVHLLPEVGDPGSIAGRTTCAWHGIPKGAKVGIALGDFQCSVYSCLTERTDAVLNISTSAQLTISMPLGFQPPEAPDPSSAVTYFPYFNGDYLAVAASLNGGNVLATFVGMVAQWAQELGKSCQGELKHKAGVDHQGKRKLKQRDKPGAVPSCHKGNKDGIPGSCFPDLWNFLLKLLNMLGQSCLDSTFIFPLGLLLFQAQSYFVPVDFQKAMLADLRTAACNFV
ncbi:sedoheptulokinase [Camarhynchus parvulus]|uniref:sedoheptulokinase n=1 Tax=Geospiza parvula TaxID=87175 RepID=UPI001237F474|nr:sedoheptulokinase [Camarhynchus parvulus]